MGKVQVRRWDTYGRWLIWNNDLYRSEESCI